jgi:hypothetical protein
MARPALWSIEKAHLLQLEHRQGWRSNWKKQGRASQPNLVVFFFIPLARFRKSEDNLLKVSVDQFL